MRMCLDGQLDVMRAELTWFMAEALRSHGISKETSIWRTSLQSSLPPKKAITINLSALLTSIMGQTDAWDHWQVDSNLIIHDCFSYLEPLEQLIAHEFEMYRALYNDSVNGQKGWLRNL